MIKVAANGVYTLYSNSFGTYHELMASVVGSINLDVQVRIRRGQNTDWDSITPQPLELAVVKAGLVLGFLHSVEFTVTNFTGTGYVEVELRSKEVGNSDEAPRSRAYIQSIARVYPAGISLVTPGRPRLNYQTVQNRDSQAIYFWHGLLPTDLSQTVYLPVDPVNWTPAKLTAAATFVLTYGEKIGPGELYEPHVAQTGPLYSCVQSGSAIAHVKVG